MTETNLTLEIIGNGNVLAPFSSRECTQTLTPISQGVLRRTINGILVCVSPGGHRKFASTISCKDKAPPAFDGMWIGTLVKVGCIQTMTHVVMGSSSKIQLEREALSLHLYEYSGKTWTPEKMQDRWVFIPYDFPGGFLTYRPELIMVVKNYFLETDEWGLTVGWKLELEEE